MIVWFNNNVVTVRVIPFKIKFLMDFNDLKNLYDIEGKKAKYNNFVVLWVETKALNMLVNLSTTELHPHPPIQNYRTSKISIT